MNPKTLPSGWHDTLLFALDTLRERGAHYQVLALLIAIGGAVLLWRLGAARQLTLTRLVARVSRHVVLSAVLIFASAFVLFSLPTLVTGRPVTAMSADEYGFLLTADTLRHGHLTNPPHPLWKHFENFYVIQQPTYNSKYFPAQALVMAAGWAVLGHPMYGVRLSGALACVAIFWMLCGWFDRRWALFGASIAVTSFVVFDWNQTYLGGNVALLGGALCLGAIIRIVNDLRIRDAILLGIGLSVLSNSRPFEGLVFGGCLGIFLLLWMLKDGRQRYGLVGIVTQLVIPLLIVMGLNLGWIGVYDHAATGSFVIFPYSLYVHQYEVVPLFLFQHPLVPQSPTCVMSNYNDALLAQFRSFQTFHGLTIEGIRRLVTLSITLVSISCWLVFARGFQDVLRRRRVYVPLLISIVTIGSCLILPFEPYYLAHIAPAILILTVHGSRSLYTSTRTPGWTRLVGVFIPLGQLIAIVLFIGKQGIAPSVGYSLRESVERDLKSRPGNHLVVVRELCSPANWGFVYNEANIDASKIVWARELRPQETNVLLEYYKDRHSWLLERSEDGRIKVSPLSKEVFDK